MLAEQTGELLRALTLDANLDYQHKPDRGR